MMMLDNATLAIQDSVLQLYTTDAS